MDVESLESDNKPGYAQFRTAFPSGSALKSGMLLSSVIVRRASPATLTGPCGATAGQVSGQDIPIINSIIHMDERDIFGERACSALDFRRTRRFAQRKRPFGRRSCPAPGFAQADALALRAVTGRRFASWRKCCERRRGRRPASYPCLPGISHRNGTDY